MSDKLIKNLGELARSVTENTPRVKETMSRNGREIDYAVVGSVAKYREAIEKLAKE